MNWSELELFGGRLECIWSAFGVIVKWTPRNTVSFYQIHRVLDTQQLNLSHYFPIHPSHTLLPATLLTRSTLKLQLTFPSHTNFASILNLDHTHIDSAYTIQTQTTVAKRGFHSYNTHAIHNTNVPHDNPSCSLSPYLYPCLYP